jgi:hypothetical protein
MYAAAGFVGGSLLGGGGGGGGQQQSQQVNDIPDWLKPDVQDVIGKSKALAETPYEAYGGKRVAGLSDLQKQAMGTASSPEAFGKSVQGYMNPYMQNVVDVQKRNAREQAGIAANTMNARAAQTGAFGGSGLALQRAAMNRGTARQLDEIQKVGSEAAYSQGVGQANKAMGQQWMMGGTEQGLAQRQLDTDYQEFLSKKNDPYQKIGFQSNIIRGLPVGSTSTTFAPAPTMAQNMMGMGMGMYGLNQMGMFADGGEVKSYAKGGLSEVGGPYRGKLDDVLEAHYGKAQENNDRSAMRSIEDEKAIRQYLQASIDQGVGGHPGYYGNKGLTEMQGISDMPSYSGANSSIVRALNDPGELAGSMDSMSNEQLQQIIQYPQTKAQYDAAQQELAARISEGGMGLMAAFNTLPEEDQDNVVSAAGGGILAFDDGGEVPAPQYGEAPSAGNPALYKGLTALYPDLLKRAAGSSSTPMSDADYDKRTERELEKYRTAAGPSQYERIQAQLSEMRGEEDTSTKEAKGLAWLAAADRVMKGGQTNLQALIGGSAELGKQYAQAAQANRTAKRKLQEMDINLADAKRKEDLGMYKEARTAADNARRDQTAAGKAAADRDFKLANLATSMARTVKPTNAGAGRGPKPDDRILDMELELANMPTTDPRYGALKNRVDAARGFQSRKAAGLPGVETKVESTEQLKAGERFDQGLLMRNAEIKKAQKANDTARVNEIRAEEAAKAGYRLPNAAPAASPATGGQPLYATNGKERIVSTDNGKTWKPVGAP